MTERYRVSKQPLLREPHFDGKLHLPQYGESITIGMYDTVSEALQSVDVEWQDNNDSMLMYISKTPDGFYGIWNEEIRIQPDQIAEAAQKQFEKHGSWDGEWDDGWDNV